MIVCRRSCWLLSNGEFIKWRNSRALTGAACPVAEMNVFTGVFIEKQIISRRRTESVMLGLIQKFIHEKFIRK